MVTNSEVEHQFVHCKSKVKQQRQKYLTYGQSNLPQEISEEILGMHFAKQGPVATVKIMWREFPMSLLLYVKD